MVAAGTFAAGGPIGGLPGERGTALRGAVPGIKFRGDLGTATPGPSALILGEDVGAARILLGTFAGGKPGGGGSIPAVGAPLVGFVVVVNFLRGADPAATVLGAIVAVGPDTAAE